MTNYVIPAHGWAAGAEPTQESKFLTKVILATFLAIIWITGWLCGWFCRQWWQQLGPPRLCPKGGVWALVKMEVKEWWKWATTPRMTPQEEWIAAAREAAETPSDMVESTPGEGGLTSGEEPRRESSRNIERDWWDFPSPSGRRSRWPRRTEERRKLDAGSDGSSGESGTEIESPSAQGGANNNKRRRGSLEMVIQKKWNAKQWKARSQAFCAKFLSRNTALSRNSKRRQMVLLLKQLKSEPLLPVNQDELTVLASMLDESKMAAADQYLHEIKLMQVELGGPWDISMERQLVLCKKALNRHKGPEKRAVEVKVEEIKEEAWGRRGKKLSDVDKPAWAYAWATVWMLRAAELVVVKRCHVRVSHQPRTVTLFIPKSKMDQRERGVSRTLRCSCERDCSPFCAWGLALKLLAEPEKGNKSGYLFPNTKGEKVKKSAMVSSWQKWLNPVMTGHSARRSGAMEYARRGMPLTSISFLGRWKSTAVFRYVEEALQFVPSNENKISFEDCTSKREDAYQELVSETKFMEDLGKGKDNPRKRKPEPQPKMEVKVVQEMKVEDAEELFALAPSRSQGRIAHWVTKAAWGADLDTWATACGWKFARRCEKVTLVTKVPGKAHLCQKCEAIKKGRDVVSGGATWAQMLARTFGSNLKDPKVTGMMNTSQEELGQQAYKKSPLAF